MGVRMFERVVFSGSYGACRCRVIETRERAFIAQVTTGRLPLLRRWRTVSAPMPTLDRATLQAKEWAWAVENRVC
jgi:hypothetical protein